MAEPFLAEIRIWSCNFAPRDWADCDGQYILIAHNQALYSLIGNTFGGDGITNFALPNLRARVPIHYGKSSGNSNRTFAQSLGTENVALTIDQMPAHNHTMYADDADGTTASPNGAMLGELLSSLPADQRKFYADPPASMTMNTNAIETTGANQPHSNMMPYLTIRYCIALNGIEPVKA